MICACTCVCVCVCGVVRLVGGVVKCIHVLLLLIYAELGEVGDRDVLIMRGSQQRRACHALLVHGGSRGVRWEVRTAVVGRYHVYSSGHDELIDHTGNCR